MCTWLYALLQITIVRRMGRLARYQWDQNLTLPRVWEYSLLLWFWLLPSSHLLFPPHTPFTEHHRRLTMTLWPVAVCLFSDLIQGELMERLLVRTCECSNHWQKLPTPRTDRTSHNYSTKPKLCQHATTFSKISKYPQQALSCFWHRMRKTKPEKKEEGVRCWAINWFSNVQHLQFLWIRS